MVQLNSNFDSSAVEPSTGFDPLPAGSYQCMLVDSKLTATQKGINVTFDVTAGQYQGRKIFCNLNLFHDNPKAVEMGQRLLSGMCRAAGRLAISDTSELHGASMIVKVNVKNGQNNATAFEPMQGYAQQPAPQPQAAPPMQQQQQTPPPHQPQDSRPWNNS